MIWLVAIFVVLGPAILAGLAPLWVSRITVFALAGPHNWMEFRYLASYAPTGAGLRKPFIVVAAAGTLILAILFASLVWLGRGNLTAGQHYIAFSAWQTSLFLWLLALLRLKPLRKEKSAWIAPVLLVCAGLSWLSPRLVDFAILYLHPFVAFAFLYLSVGRWRPAFLRAFWLFMLGVGVAVCALAILLWDAGSIVPDQTLATQALRRAGISFLPMASNHMLLAIHTFLETLHYVIWLVAIPIFGMRSLPWRLTAVPLARKSGTRRVLLLALVGSGLLVLLLWLAFIADPIVTFEVYFTVAMIHVIAELPCLLRLSAA